MRRRDCHGLSMDYRNPSNDSLCFEKERFPKKTDHGNKAKKDT